MFQFKWLEEGAFLVMYMGSQPRGTPDAIWLIGRDELTTNYVVLYYDNRKVSRVYEMSFSDGTWKMWRNSPGFSQRFEGKLSEDGEHHHGSLAEFQRRLDLGTRLRRNLCKA